MRKATGVLAILIGLSLGLQVFSQATNDELITVIATGYGRTPREAEKDALRAAVQKAVGVYVSSTTMTQNEDLINDQILTASNGIVKEYAPSGDPKLNQTLGLYEQTITAKVIKKILLAKLDENKIAYSATVSGLNLYAQAASMQERDAAADKLFLATWNDIFGTNMEKLFKIRMLGPNGETGDGFTPKLDNNGNGSVTVKFSIELDYDLAYWYEIVAPRWAAVLDTIAIRKASGRVLSKTFEKSERYVSFPVADQDPARQAKKWATPGPYRMSSGLMNGFFNGNDNDASGNILVLLATAQDRTGGTVECSGWMLPKRFAAYPRSTFSMNRLARFSIQFLDSSGNVITQSPITREMQFKMTSDGRKYNFSASNLDMMNFMPFFLIEKGSYSEYMQFAMIEFSQEVTPDILKEIAKIQLYYKAPVDQ